ncbi:MAG: peptidylprolyl isomerase [Chitinispirillaceae bacterium]|nr:peptidylprolyl isomerase [Chitinispirillaceae bacterium]
MIRRLFLCACILSSIAGCSKKPREGVAVIVNGHEITSSQVLQAAEMIRESMIAAYPEKAFEGGVTSDLSSGAAQQLIANRLLIEEAQRLGIEADSGATDSAYNIIMGRFPDRAAFERELTKMGETDSSFRAQIREGVRLDALMERILADTPPIDTQEYRAFYEKNKTLYVGNARVRAGQIFFPFKDSISETEKQQLLAKVKKVRQQIQEGTRFAECAKEYSRGPGAIDGGDIGWFKRGDLKPELEQPLFLLKKGETSDIIVTDVGLFLLHKTDEEAEKQLPFEEVEKRIRFLLEIKKRNSLISGHLDSLMAEAKILYIDTSLAHGKPLRDLNLFPEKTP